MPWLWKNWTGTLTGFLNVLHVRLSQHGGTKYEICVMCQPSQFNTACSSMELWNHNMFQHLDWWPSTYEFHQRPWSMIRSMLQNPTCTVCFKVEKHMWIPHFKVPLKTHMLQSLWHESSVLKELGYGRLKAFWCLYTSLCQHTLLGTGKYTSIKESNKM